MQGALYFPYINVPASPWWTRTLLYWDLVGTIVPMSHRERPELLDDHTLELVREGFVRQFLPEDAGYELKRNFERFLNRLDAHEVDRRRRSFDRYQVQLIHRDKFLSYAGGLQEIERMGLARRVDYEWTAVESTTAAEFMVALTLALCEEAARAEDDYSRQAYAGSWVPTTDTPNALAVLLSGLEPSPQERAARRVTLRVKGEIAAVEVRAELLENLLPVPTVPIAARELLAFRGKYGDLLPSLRRFLEAKVDEALAVEDEVLRFRALDRLAEEVEERVAQAETYLKEIRFGRISRSSLLRLFKFIPGAKDLVEAGQDLAENLRTNPNFESEPLAYLAFARATFAPARVYQPDPRLGIPLTEAMSLTQ